MKKEDELELLRNRVRELEAKQEASNKGTDVGRSFYQELESIKRKGNHTGGNIQYKDIQDHVGVVLYHQNGLRIGKRLGTLHPANAEYAFKEFDKKGIKLSLNKPSASEIEDYKNTAEFKKLFEVFRKERDTRKRSRKGNDVEKLTEAIAAMSGIPRNQINSIKSREEVGV